ncbi:MAG: efflux RND transporter permease subunit, partial [bacterium]|nr:efflux RND transporter permease subunit [bacterium]
MDISKWSFSNRNLIYFLIAVLLAGGIFGCYQMSKLEDPEIKVKLAMVVTTYPGASAHQVELEVTDPLEKQIRSMGNVNSIQLRETGPMSATGAKVHNEDYDISSLGTLFVVDGAPLNEDANLQNVPSTDVSQPEYKRDATNRGVDMRT